MRQLNTGDAFKLLQIFRAAGAKDDFAALMNTAITAKNSEEIGGEMFVLLFNCLGHEKTEPLIMKLLADITGTKPEKIAQQPIPDTIAMIKEIAQASDLKSFFGNAAALTK